MHRKNICSDPITEKASGWKAKRNIVVGGLKINKLSLQPFSKSEKNSPSAIKSYKIRDTSTSRSSINRQSSPKTLKETEGKITPKNFKIFKANNIKTLKKSIQESSGLHIRQSPHRKSPKITFLKRKKSDKNVIETSKSNASLTKKFFFQKEKEDLIKLITSHFEENVADPSTSLKYYSMLKLLGEGAFGKVTLGVQILTGIKVAIKAIDRSHLQNEHSRRKIFREVYILKKLRSNYVVKILEVFESEDNFLIVMEHMQGGDLLNYLKINGKMPELLCKKIFLQIILGAITIHKHGILHRDFKLDNILLDKALTKIKICDFGVSKLMHKGEIIMDQCGTPAYLAPEIVLDQGYEGYWSDIWSLGVLLYCMACGTVPFKANTLSDLHKAILLGKFECPDFLSEEVKDLIKAMLQIIPNKRIPLETVINHKWFNDIKESFDEVSIEEETLRLNQDVVRVIESYGYPRQFLMNSLEYKSLNHAYALYNLLTNK